MIFICLLFLFFAIGVFILNSERKQSLAKKIYISGPMTGYAYNNFFSFDDAEKRILNEIKNINIVNPCDLSNKTESIIDNPSYEDYLREDFRALIDCDAVLLLDGWKESSGCNKEFTVANYLKIPCFETFEELKKYLEENNGCKN